MAIDSLTPFDLAILSSFFLVVELKVKLNWFSFLSLFFSLCLFFLHAVFIFFINSLPVLVLLSSFVVAAKFECMYG